MKTIVFLVLLTVFAISCDGKVVLSNDAALDTIFDGGTTVVQDRDLDTDLDLLEYYPSKAITECIQ